MIRLATLAAAGLGIYLSCTPVQSAGAAAPNTGAPERATEAAQAQGYAEGEVRRIDKEAGKITLKHGPIASLEMPPMSMVFRAADPALLDRVKEGDKVRFKADRVQGALTVTEIEPVK